MNFQCSITCSSSYSCYQSTINATASSLFTLNGCDSNNSCSSISIYFPSHDSGAPRGIIQMDNSLTADVVDYSFIDVSFYAENGWSDIDISSYNGQFQNDHQGIMHCSPDYSLQCEFGRCSNTCDDYIAEEMEGSTRFAIHQIGLELYTKNLKNMKREKLSLCHAEKRGKCIILCFHRILSMIDIFVMI